MTRIDRRTLVRGLAGASLAGAAAGCIGGDADSGDGGTTTATEPFGVSNLVFAAEEPTGYGEYVEQPDATYEPGDVVWLYFEIDGAGTESAGEGEARFRLTQDVTVTGPGGDTYRDDTVDVEQSVPEGSTDDGLYFHNDVTLTSDAAGGEYEFSFELTDEVTGESVTESATFSVDGPPRQVSADGPFGASNLVFCREQPGGYGEYAEQPGAAYLPGQPVWLYFEIDGVAATRTGSGVYETDISQAVTVTGPDGGTVFEERYTGSAEAEDAAALERYWYFNKVPLSADVATGEYELSFELTDEVTGESVTESATFVVEPRVVETDRAFDVAEFVFCAAEPAAYGEYEAQPDATYRPGDDVWVYLDVVGLGYERTADGGLVRFREEIAVRGPRGNVVYENANEFEDEVPRNPSLETYFVTDGLTTTADVPAGTYAVDVTLTDLVTGAETTASSEFTIAN